MDSYQFLKKILPSSKDEESIKLFDLLSPSNNNNNQQLLEQEKLLSFDAILNDDKCFNESLKAMGCIIDNNKNSNLQNNHSQLLDPPNSNHHQSIYNILEISPK